MYINLTPQEKEQLKANCLAIKEFLIDLVKDCTADTTISVDFFNETEHRQLGISARKRAAFTRFDGEKFGESYEVYGYIGGLSIRFEENSDDSSHSIAWKQTDYGIELIKQRQSIKAQFIRKLESDRATRQAIATFKV